MAQLLDLKISTNNMAAAQVTSSVVAATTMGATAAYPGNVTNTASASHNTPWTVPPGFFPMVTREDQTAGLPSVTAASASAGLGWLWSLKHHPKTFTDTGGYSHMDPQWQA